MGVLSGQLSVAPAAQDLVVVPEGGLDQGHPGVAVLLALGVVVHELSEHAHVGGRDHGHEHLGWAGLAWGQRRPVVGVELELAGQFLDGLNDGDLPGDGAQVDDVAADRADKALPASLADVQVT